MSQTQKVVCGLPDDEKFRAGRNRGGLSRSDTVGLFPYDKKKSNRPKTFRCEFPGGRDHRRHNSLGVARAAAVQIFGVLSGSRKRRDGIEVSTEDEPGFFTPR